MRRTLVLTLGLALFLVAPGFAAETLSLYDNFNSSSLINYTKWTGSASDVLETYKYIIKVSTDPAPADRELFLPRGVMGSGRAPPSTTTGEPTTAFASAGSTRT